LVDDLLNGRTIPGDSWRNLRRCLGEAQIVEAITLFCAGLELLLEDNAARFPGAFKLEEGT